MVKARDKKQLKLRVMNFLRQGIKKQDFKPGEHIKELYVTEKLSLSRAPVREAFLELSAEGLLRLDPNRGAHVLSLAPEEIVERLLLCGALEGFALSRTLPLFTPLDFQHLEASVERMRRLAETGGDIAAILEEDVHFHHLCVSHVTDAFLHEFIEKCSRIPEVLLAKDWARAYTAGEIVSRHQELCRVLRGRDPDLVEKTVRGHYLETAQKLSRFGTRPPQAEL